jgi:hypothetical protein
MDGKSIFKLTAIYLIRTHDNHYEQLMLTPFQIMPACLPLAPSTALP